jgi:hypothetical protein
VASIECARELFHNGERDAGIRELRATVAEHRASAESETALETVHLLLTLSYHLQEAPPEPYAECESLLREAEGLLSSAGERPDSTRWLAWHTAIRRMYLAQHEYEKAAAASETQLERMSTLADANPDDVSRLRMWQDADLLKARALSTLHPNEEGATGSTG